MHQAPLLLEFFALQIDNAGVVNNIILVAAKSIAQNESSL